MLKSFFASRRRRNRSYNWKPALDLTNPRVAAALSTFPTN